MASAQSNKGDAPTPKSTPDARQAPAAGQDSSAPGTDGTPHKRAVSPLVFGLAVALALVLGLYVGSLAPALFAPASDSGPGRQAAPAAPPAPSAAQENQPPMPPELAAKIAELEKSRARRPGQGRPLDQPGQPLL